MFMKKRICFQVVATLVFSLNVCAADTGNMFSSPVAPVGPAKTAGPTISQKTATLPGENTMKLIIRTGNDRLTATLSDNAATRDFISLLPVTVTLEDFNKTEKIAMLPEKLSTAGLPSGYTPSEGDIAYYVPWGNMCVFYRDFRYSDGLVHLGKIEGNGIGHFRGDGPVTVTISLQE